MEGIQCGHLGLNMHVCLVEERNESMPTVDRYGCVSQSRSVPTTTAGCEEHDMSIEGRLFGKGGGGQQIL